VAAEEGLLPHERSRDRDAQLEEERRLMFVGLTRAQEELQISMAGYRDFRGQRKMTVPSRFLMELPRGEMEVRDLTAAAAHAEPFYQAPVAEPAAAHAPAPTARPRTSGVRLTTAAELAGGAPCAPTAPTAPDQFHQGMLVRHPTHGLGRVVALSGSGAGRKATVNFASGAGQRKFVISGSPLRPVKK
jgi:DNA helicase-2/ATP-dependent DNA helicase PcrA